MDSFHGEQGKQSINHLHVGMGMRLGMVNFDPCVYDNSKESPILQIIPSIQPVPLPKELSFYFWTSLKELKYLNIEF